MRYREDHPDHHPRCTDVITSYSIHYTKLYDFEVSEKVAILYALKRKLALSSEAAVIGRTEPNWHHERYYVNVHLRRDVYKGFVFLDLGPQIDFYRGGHFRCEPSISLSLEVLYGVNYRER